jgi:pentatricopeptide repeat protein
MVSSSVYFDTNVWFSYFVKDKHTEKAIRLFEKAEENGIKIAVSHLILLELFDVIRKRTIENCDFKDLSAARKGELIKKYEDKRTEVAEKISRLWKEQKIEIKNPNEKIEDHYKEIYKYLVQSFGDIGEKDWCFDCKQKIPQKKNRYLGAGHLDFQHACIAKNFKVQQFFTFDKGFSEIKKNTAFDLLKIEIL